MGIIANFVYYGKTRMVFVTELKDSKESLTAPVEEQCFEKNKIDWKTFRANGIELILRKFF